MMTCQSAGIDRFFDGMDGYSFLPAWVGVEIHLGQRCSIYVGYIAKAIVAVARQHPGTNRRGTLTKQRISQGDDEVP
jgi:hypothetical protein